MLVLREIHFGRNFSSEKLTAWSYNCKIQVKSKADMKGKISIVLLLRRYGRNSIPGASTTISLHLGTSRPCSNTNSIQMRNRGDSEN
nr:uncharacterized protein LOC119715884 isoform X3 [Anas platyrhynchos]